MSDEPRPPADQPESPAAHQPAPPAPESSAADQPAPPAPELSAAAPDVAAEAVPSTAPVPDSSAAWARVPIDLGDGDVAFDATLDAETLIFGQATAAPRVCEWCNATLPADADPETCPSCGTRLQPVEADLEVPGVTTLSAEARVAAARVDRRLREAIENRPPGPLAAMIGVPTPPPMTPEGAASVLAGGGSVDPFAPPDPEVERVMLEMELDALLAKREAPFDEDLDAAEAVAGGDSGAGPVVGGDIAREAQDAPFEEADAAPADQGNANRSDG